MSWLTVLLALAWYLPALWKLLKGTTPAGVPASERARLAAALGLCDAIRAEGSRLGVESTPPTMPTESPEEEAKALPSTLPEFRTFADGVLNRVENAHFGVGRDEKEFAAKVSRWLAAADDATVQGILDA